MKDKRERSFTNRLTPKHPHPPGLCQIGTRRWELKSGLSAWMAGTQRTITCCVPLCHFLPEYHRRKLGRKADPAFHTFQWHLNNTTCLLMLRVA